MKHNTTTTGEYSPSERAFLLKLARDTITAALKGEKQSGKLEEQAPEALRKKRGCFVTLHINRQLRGCIGTILPANPLYESVRSNALNAAFHDPRFPPLAIDELTKVHIEISVLTIPEKIIFKDAEDLKQQLLPNVHGVILSSRGRSATFLPQVWEQLPDKEQFLEHLCAKGRMEKSCWKDPETRVEVYRAEVFSEDLQ
ncbi:MAG: AmmeMemoRadiSam system protein A [Pseudomonadota bacterium]